jgi:hypothetical protein
MYRTRVWLLVGLCLRSRAAGDGVPVYQGHAGYEVTMPELLRLLTAAKEFRLNTLPLEVRQELCRLILN